MVLVGWCSRRIQELPYNTRLTTCLRVPVFAMLDKIYVRQMHQLPLTHKPSRMSKQFSSVQSAVDAIRRGEVVIVLDAEDRENEGDYICAAELVTPQIINFMLRGRGQLCCPILPATCERLHLKPIVENNDAPLRTAFMTPVDYNGSKTGITAQERAETIRRLASSTTTAQDFVRPGHVYPLLAMEGGVLQRAGHTEAAVDLPRMAGLSPAGVLTEILDDSGDRATRDELLGMAAKHHLEIITIEQLIAHRRVNEKLVTRARRRPSSPPNLVSLKSLYMKCNSRRRSPSPSSWETWWATSHRLRWYACTAVVSLVICWSRCVVIVAISFTWHST